MAQDRSLYQPNAYSLEYTRKLIDEISKPIKEQEVFSQ